MPLNPAELTHLQRIHTSTLRHTCQIWRKDSTVNSAGGPADNWVLMYDEVPCRLMPENSRRVIEALAGREAMMVYYRLALPVEADLRADDRVILEGVTYQVAALWNQHTLRTACQAIVAHVA